MEYSTLIEKLGMERRQWRYVTFNAGRAVGNRGKTLFRVSDGTLEKLFGIHLPILLCDIVSSRYN